MDPALQAGFGGYVSFTKNLHHRGAPYSNLVCVLIREEIPRKHQKVREPLASRALKRRKVMSARNDSLANQSFIHYNLL